MTIIEQLTPKIRKVGVNEIARRTGIHAASISRWLNGAKNTRLGDEQLDAIASVLGTKWTLTIAKKEA